MPNWKKVIVSGSSAALTSVTATAGFTGSLLGTSSFASFATIATNASMATSASYALTAVTASYVNTLNQSVIITGSLAVGTSSLGPFENTITLGARDNGSEGGQLGFSAPGGTYASASFIDLYQNRLRILKGTNATSTGEVANWSMHNLQMALPAYTSPSSFPGTATATLAVDSSGNVITIAGAGGGTVTSVSASGTVNGITLGGGPITTSGTITLSGTISGLTNGNLSGTAGITNANLANPSLMIGTTGIALGATGSSLAGLTSVTATNFTGTASYATQALSSSYALSASYTLNAASASYIRTPTGRTIADDGSGNVYYTANRHLITASNSITIAALNYIIFDQGTAQFTNPPSLPNTLYTLTASYATQALSSSYALSASYALNATTSSYALNTLSSSYALSASYARTASYVNPLIQTVTITGSLITSASSGNGINTSTTTLTAGPFTTVNWGNSELYDTNNTVTVDWEQMILSSPQGGGVSTVYWGAGWLKTLTTSMSIDWDARLAYANDGTSSIDWGTRALNDSFAFTSLDWDNRALYDLSGAGSIDWNARLAVSSNLSRSLDYQNRMLYDVLEVNSLEWNNRTLYDDSGVDSVLWNYRTTQDSTGVESIDWDARLLKSPSAIKSLDWSQDTSLYSAVYQTDVKNLDLQQVVSDPHPGSTYFGDVIVGNITSGGPSGYPSDGQLCFLGTDGFWYKYNQASTSYYGAMVGIVFNVDTGAETCNVLLEGHVLIDDSGAFYPKVQNADHGLPVYIMESTTDGEMSTTIPTQRIVQVMGHCYYQHPTTSANWMMKFKPSSDWYTI